MHYPISRLDIFAFRRRFDRHLESVRANDSWLMLQTTTAPTIKPVRPLEDTSAPAIKSTFVRSPSKIKRLTNRF
ncbi:MAG: hypothetical protein P9M15_08000 [Candidatus Electryoneaceae bacterium]|nr:hypothetical protein [Candidatus Electryoneaceae bacterium]